MNNESECFTGISKHEKTMYENTSAKRECFHTLFSIVWISAGETRARVVYMASQMNRDVTECFRLLIWIEFLTKHIVIRNSIEIHMALTEVGFSRCTGWVKKTDTFAANLNKKVSVFFYSPCIGNDLIVRIKSCRRQRVITIKAILGVNLFADLILHT
jgi:hypothetical protein